MKRGLEIYSLPKANKTTSSFSSHGSGGGCAGTLRQLKPYGCGLATPGPSQSDPSLHRNFIAEKQRFIPEHSSGVSRPAHSDRMLGLFYEAEQDQTIRKAHDGHLNLGRRSLDVPHRRHQIQTSFPNRSTSCIPRVPSSRSMMVPSVKSGETYMSRKPCQSNAPVGHMAIRTDEIDNDDGDGPLSPMEVQAMKSIVPNLDDGELTINADEIRRLSLRVTKLQERKSSAPVPLNATETESRARYKSSFGNLGSLFRTSRRRQAPEFSETIKQPKQEAPVTAHFLAADSQSVKELKKRYSVFFRGWNSRKASSQQLSPETKQMPLPILQGYGQKKMDISVSSKPRPILKLNATSQKPKKLNFLQKLLKRGYPENTSIPGIRAKDGRHIPQFFKSQINFKHIDSPERDSLHPASVKDTQRDSQNDMGQASIIIEHESPRPHGHEDTGEPKVLDRRAIESSVYDFILLLLPANYLLNG